MNIAVIVIVAFAVFLLSRIFGQGHPGTGGNARVMEEFRRRKFRQWLVTIPMLLVFLPLIWLKQHPASMLLGLSLMNFVVAALVVTPIGLFFSFRNWRCPACDRYLGKAMNPRVCRRCRATLQ